MAEDEYSGEACSECWPFLQVEAPSEALSEPLQVPVVEAEVEQADLMVGTRICPCLTLEAPALNRGDAGSIRWNSCRSR